MYYNIRPKSAPKRVHYGAFTFDVKSVLNENLGSILGSTNVKWVIASVFFFLGEESPNFSKKSRLATYRLGFLW